MSCRLIFSRLFLPKSFQKKPSSLIDCTKIHYHPLKRPSKKKAGAKSGCMQSANSYAIEIKVLIDIRASDGVAKINKSTGDLLLLFLSRAHTILWEEMQKRLHGSARCVWNHHKNANFIREFLALIVLQSFIAHSKTHISWESRESSKRRKWNSNWK